MTHVQITLMPQHSSGSSFVIDGEDITRAVRAGSVRVELDGIVPLVHLTMMADRLDIDLPQTDVLADVAVPERLLCEDPEAAR